MMQNDNSYNIKRQSSDSLLLTVSRNVYRLTAILSASVLFTACGSSTDDVVPVLPDEANERVTITNNLSTLASRVSYSNQNVAIAPTFAALKATTTTQTNATISFKLVTQIQPPVIDEQRVQATSVSLTKLKTAVISYNMQGAPRMGAVDWIYAPGYKLPSLTSGITFTDADINAVHTDGKYVYTAVATNAADFPFPAVMERLKVEYRSTTLLENERVPLTSFAATSVLPIDKVVYATSGNTGGIYAFNSKNLEPLGEYPLHDARWVAHDEINSRLVVAQGTPGVLSIFKENEFVGGSMTLLNTFSFPGANIAESKTTVEVTGGKAFIAAGPEGVQIMCLNDGSIIGSIPRPDPVALGLDPAVVVTNAVSVDDDLMFISNGEAGIYVAQGSQEFSNNNCAAQHITMLGKLSLGDLQSANHVAYKSHYLYIAAGLGGVKIVKVDVEEDEDDD